MPLGNSYQVRQGDLLAAVGSPAGVVHSLDYGFVSYVVRSSPMVDQHHRLDLLYALSSQRELLLEWYDFEPEAEVLQVGADYGALTGLLRSSVSAVTVLDDTESALETVRQRYPGAANIHYHKDSLYHCLLPDFCPVALKLILLDIDCGNHAVSFEHSTAD